MKVFSLDIDPKFTLGQIVTGVVVIIAFVIQTIISEKLRASELEELRTTMIDHARTEANHVTREETLYLRKDVAAEKFESLRIELADIKTILYANVQGRKLTPSDFEGQVPFSNRKGR